MAHLRISRFGNVSVSWLIVSLLALLIVSCGIYLLYPSIHARYLFSEFQTLQVGRSTFEDAERLARKIDAKPYYVHCYRSTCGWDARVDNAGLPRWWRGSGETFSVSFLVKDSIVVSKITGFGTGTAEAFHPSGVLFEEQEHWAGGNIREPVQATWDTTNKLRYYRFTVRMTPKASAEDWLRYTAFNYRCFWKYKGCRDARDLLPTADPLPDDK